MKKTIQMKVQESAEVLKSMTTTKQLRQWAIENGMDNRSAFPKFKTALELIGISYDGIKGEKLAGDAAALDSLIKHTVTLYSDAKASMKRFGICDSEGNPLWHGRFFDSDEDFNGEQSSGELAAAKKAVWLASKIKEAIGAQAIELVLIVDAQWLIYQDHAGQKGYVLSSLAKKHNIRLVVEWIPGKNNPADEYTTCNGFMKWSDNDLTKLVTEIVEAEVVEQVPNIELSSSEEISINQNENHMTTMQVTIEKGSATPEVAESLRREFDKAAKKLNMKPNELNPYQVTDVLNKMYSSVRGQFLTVDDGKYTLMFKEIFSSEISMVESAKKKQVSNSKTQVQEAITQLEDLYPQTQKQTPKDKKMKEKKDSAKPVAKLKEKTPAKFKSETIPAPDFEKLEKMTADSVMEILRPGVNSINKFKKVIQSVEDSKLKIRNRRSGELVQTFKNFKDSEKTPGRNVCTAVLESGDERMFKLDCFTNFYEVI